VLRCRPARVTRSRFPAHLLQVGVVRRTAVIWLGVISLMLAAPETTLGLSAFASAAPPSTPSVQAIVATWSVTPVSVMVPTVAVTTRSPTGASAALTDSTPDPTSTLTRAAPSAFPTMVNGLVSTPIAHGSFGPNSTAVALPPPVRSIATAAPQTALPTATAMQTPSSTVTLTPTPAAEIAHVVAIEPAAVSNDQATRITVVGADFIDTRYAVRVGERALADVRVESFTALTGTLPAGLCPGAYAATVTDAIGHQATGGSIQVRGTRSATSVAGDIAAPAITLVGRAQHATVALPMVQIRDTTCGTGDLHLLVSVTDFAHSGGRPSRLVPLSIAAEGDTGNPSQPLRAASGRGTASLLIHRPDSSGLANIALSTEIEIPSHPAAGDYRATVTVSLLEDHT
jgi:hypothetical protein